MFVKEKDKMRAAIRSAKNGWGFVIERHPIEIYLSIDIFMAVIRSYEGLWMPRWRYWEELDKTELYQLALLNKLPTIGIPIYEDGLLSYEDFINENKR